MKQNKETMTPQTAITLVKQPPFSANHALAYTLISTLEKQVPKTPVNKQGYPVWGYCPSCGQVVSRTRDVVGCSNCLQRLNWNESEVV